MSSNALTVRTRLAPPSDVECWDLVKRRSEEYCRRLNISDANWDTIDRCVRPLRNGYPSLKDQIQTGFLKITVAGRQFSLFVHQACRSDFKGKSVKMIQAACV